MASTPLQDDRFLLLEAIGRGGMGRIYRAFDRAEQQLVALKVLREAEQPGPGHPLSAEFETWSGLCHPNIVRAYELARSRSGPLARNRPYLVLEHVAGGPAHQVLDPGRVPATRLEEVAAQVLLALAHVHAAGYVHRDLKPGNVLVVGGPGRAPRVKVTDFGLAAPVGSSGTPGQFSGSIPYASPEALLAEPVDGRSDLYGLGLLLYQLAAGELPTRGGPEEFVRWHLDGPPADPSHRRALPPRLVRLIRRLTERDRDARPASAAAALGILGRATPTAEGAACAIDRGERAKLRLALDAVRLGASRFLELPASPAAAAPLLHEVSVWAQVRGLCFFTLGHDEGSGSLALARLVLRLLSERAGEAAACVARFGLAGRLPLALLGELPILDHRAARPTLPQGGVDLARPAAGIRRFLIDCARRRPIVLVAGPTASAEPLAAEVVRQLRLAVSRRSEVSPGRGGLLLLAGPRRATSRLVRSCPG